MKRIPYLRTALCLSAACLMLAAGSASADAYRKARPQGWLWYEDDAPKPAAKPQPKQPPKAQAAPAAPAAAPAVQAAPEPFSAAWVRAQLPVLLDRAMTNPTDENVRAYKYMSRLMVDMSMNFADASERVVRNDPMLDESVRFPIASMARAQALSQISQAKEGIIRDLSGKAGLWLFFDSKCRFCHSQYAVVQMLAKKYGLQVRYISTDGGVIGGMTADQLRFDLGGSRARTLGIKLTPAVVLAAPPEQMAIVAHGAMSQSELEDKIVLAAIDMKLASPELTDLARLQERGVLTPQDIAKARSQIRNPENPDELVRMLNGLIRNRM